MLEENLINILLPVLKHEPVATFLLFFLAAKSLLEWRWRDVAVEA